MGIYNTYGKVQLKVEADCTLKSFKVGDRVTLNDGVYFGNEGCVVVKNGIFIGEFSEIHDKWGKITSVVIPLHQISSPLSLERYRVECKDKVDKAFHLLVEVKRLLD